MEEIGYRRDIFSISRSRGKNILVSNECVDFVDISALLDDVLKWGEVKVALNRLDQILASSHL